LAPVTVRPSDAVAQYDDGRIRGVDAEAGEDDETLKIEELDNFLPLFLTGGECAVYKGIVEQDRTLI